MINIKKLKNKDLSSCYDLINLEKHNFSDLKVFTGNEIDNNKIVVSIHFYIVGVAGPQSTTVELQRLR